MPRHVIKPNPDKDEYVLKGSDLRDFCVAQEINDIATMKKLTRLVEETSHDNLC